MSKLKNSNLGAQRTEHEGGSVGVLPVHHAPDARPGHVCRVVLGPDEAVLHQRAAERVDAVPVCPPGEDLHPLDLGGPGRSASKSSIRRFVITEKAPTRAFSWLKAATTAFTFKTPLRQYAKRALTPQ